jgi:D-alanyl-lipoteichoic acid acyltransferase DltB (MBOAT superfamily)
MQLLNLILAYSGLLVALSWLLPDRWQVRSILLGTLLFMVWKAPVSLLILSVTTLSSYWIFQSRLNSGWAAVLILLQNVALFILYKLGIAQEVLSPIDRFLPLGLSYYSFRQIHFALEKYKGKLAPHNFEEYAAYLFFLPTMLIGPIHRFQPFLRNMYRRRWNSELFSEGLERILYGYAKIVIIGNFLLTDLLTRFSLYLQEDYPWWSAYTRVMNYTLNTYFQFAGFSDVAIGLGLLMGFRVMENFNSPFSAPNINEFWNRWHISLSSWCKDYVYTTTASITRKPIIGILLTMLVIGLWHEISWRYVIWGSLHGLGIAVWHLYNRSKIPDRIGNGRGVYHLLSVLITFHFVAFSFILIKEENWQAVGETIRALAGLQ